MPDKIKIKVEVNGKVVPISDISAETLLEVREADAEQRVPVAQLCDLGYIKDRRLVLQVSDSVREKISIGCKTVTINLETGRCENWSEEGWSVKDHAAGSHTRCYTNYQDLTPKD